MVRDILCKGCGACAEVCPREAITITPESGRKIDRTKCDRCLLCVPVCIYHSLNICGKYMEVGEVVGGSFKGPAFL